MTVTETGNIRIGVTTAGHGILAAGMEMTACGGRRRRRQVALQMDHLTLTPLIDNRDCR